MKIGILQTGHVPEPLAKVHGKYPSMFAKLLDGHGFSFATFVVVDEEFPNAIHDCDAWLVTGSAHGAYEDHAFIPPLEEFIRAAYKADVPIAGICFGHQIMAQALGGKVAKFEGGWSIGHTTYELGGKQTELLAMHQDQVIEKPADAEIIASSDFCANAGFAYKGKAISFQPHPEFTPEFVRDLIELRAGKSFSTEQADAAMKEIQEKNNSSEIALRLADFFLSAKKEKAA